MAASTEKAKSEFTVTTPTDREIVMTRMFDAPRRLVFEATTEPEHLKRWWGPRNMTMSVCDIDFRVGGTYWFVLRKPSGHEYGFHGVYQEIVRPERIVNTQVFEGMPGAEALVTMTLEERGGRTLLTSTLLHGSREARDGHLQAGMEAGARESNDRLAELLIALRRGATGVADPLQREVTIAQTSDIETYREAMNTADREIVISRVFDAPKELVFDAFTDSKHLGHWWGPNGFTTTTHEIDVRPGGCWRFVMHGPDGTDYQNKILYIEVARPDRLVYKHAGAEDIEPVRFHVTITFVDQAGKTNVTMRSVFESAEERNRVVEQYGAIEGGKQTLARLADHLAQAAKGEGQ